MNALRCECGWSVNGVDIEAVVGAGQSHALEVHRMQVPADVLRHRISPCEDDVVIPDGTLPTWRRSHGGSESSSPRGPNDESKHSRD